MSWKYTDSTLRFAVRTLADGRQESCLASSVPEGEVIADADPAPIPSAAQQIDSLERAALLPRASREFMLTFMEQKAVEIGQTQGLTQEQSIAVLRASNLGYRRVKELDEQIEVLRGQL